MRATGLVKYADQGGMRRVIASWFEALVRRVEGLVPSARPSRVPILVPVRTRRR